MAASKPVPADRSFSDVLTDIVRNVQDIVRSEIRLARSEVRQDLRNARIAGTLLGIGALGAIFGVFFLLLCIVDALSVVMPPWAATLIVAIALCILAAILLKAGSTRLKRIDAAPKTVSSIKENVEWVKHQTK